MKKVVISGRSMPAIGIGTWHMGDSNSLRKQEIEAIRTGIENGENTFEQSSTILLS